MTHPYSRYFNRHRLRRAPKRGRSIVVLLLLLLLWSLSLGWGLAQATEPRSTTAAPPTAPAPAKATTQPSSQPSTSAKPATIGTVDVIPARYKLGKDLYLQTCATCHVGLPPETMPTETWRQLLLDPQHYGAQLQPIGEPNLQIIWQYMRDFSRPQTTEEETPYRIYQSRYFKVLHPKVKLPSRVGLGSCASCHPGADKYDFRTLSAEWQNAP